jgi:hypothetical protein
MGDKITDEQFKNSIATQIRFHTHSKVPFEKVVDRIFQRAQEWKDGNPHDWEASEQNAWHWLLRRGTINSGMQHGDCFKVVDVIYALRMAAKPYDVPGTPLQPSEGLLSGVWNDWNTTRFPKDNIDLDKIEVLFDDGKIIKYQDPWPVSVATHWRVFTQDISSTTKK